MKWNFKYLAGNGFVLVEVLIAAAILSVVLLSVSSGIASGIKVINNSRNYTQSMVIAKSLINEFRNNKMQGTDIRDEIVEDNPDFRYDRITSRYDQPFFGPLVVNKTTITVKWRYKGREEHYDLMMIYQVK